MRTALLQLTLLALLSVTGVACGSRQHMSDDFGQQSRSFFQKQRVHAAAAQGSPGGLDSEEAALIQASYKDALGKDRQPASDGPSRVLLLKESDGAPSSGP